jgi:hypothetical protein
MEPAKTTVRWEDGFRPNPQLRLREQLREVVREAGGGATAGPGPIGATTFRVVRFVGVFPKVARPENQAGPPRNLGLVAGIPVGIL